MLPFVRACELEQRPEERRWLIEGLWSEAAVGIVGGEPKCCKSFLALDVAVSVASGKPCLRRFAIAQPGPVLLYAAEDALDVVRRRLDGIASAAGTRFDRLDVHVITAPSLRLDAVRDREALAGTVAAVRPRLLVLDPFVRLHRIDENAAADVAPLLAYLRELQRQHQVAVMLVHHARKGGGRLRAGQALRGSSELHAWGDSNLYLRRQASALRLEIEHRAAATPDGLRLDLRESGRGLALEIVEDSGDEKHEDDRCPIPLSERIVAALAAAREPMSWRELRDACRVRGTTLGNALRELLQHHRIIRSSDGYSVATIGQPASASGAPMEDTGSGSGKLHPTDLPGETEAGSAEEQPAEG